MFPLYEADEGIAGAPGKRPENVPVDVAAFFAEAGPCSCKGKRSPECEPTDASGPPPCCPPSGETHDDLDDLIDALDELDV